MNRNIETQRMILRPLNIDDASDVFEWAIFTLRRE